MARALLRLDIDVSCLTEARFLQQRQGNRRRSMFVHFGGTHIHRDICLFISPKSSTPHVLETQLQPTTLRKVESLAWVPNHSNRLCFSQRRLECEGRIGRLLRP